MIAGIGVDVVDLARFERAIGRTPRLAERLFTPAERMLPVRSLAARFAAKEALIKALGGSDGVGWHDLEVVGSEAGAPRFADHEALAALFADRGIRAAHLSMTHDAGIACAFVVLDGAGS